MSDFLRHLAARGLGTDAGLRPRLPALFEAGHPAAMPAERAAGVDAGTLPTAPDDAAKRLPGPVPAMPGPTIGAQPVPRSRAAAIQPAADPALRAPPPRRAAPPGGAQRPAAVRTHTPPAAQPALDAAVTPARGRTPAPEPRTPLRIRARLADPGPPAIRDVDSTTPESTPGTSLAPARVRSSPHAEPMPAPVRGVAAIPHAAPTVVQVHIGRIEVRAAPAMSPAARRRDAPHPASLEDYLRARGGGSG